MAERYPRTIAYHLEQAAIAALDLNPRERNLADRAVEALAHAGDIARRKIESRSAAELLSHALALAGSEEGWGVREASILSRLGEALYWLGDFDVAERTLQRALDVGDGRLRTVRGLLARGWDQGAADPAPGWASAVGAGAFLRGPEAFAAPLPREGKGTLW